MFKLADFGTARELAPGETFFSLHGTEEYLYPGMYERALVNPQKKKDFSAKVSAQLDTCRLRCGRPDSGSGRYCELHVTIVIFDMVDYPGLCV